MALSRLPSSPSRTQALVAFEPALLKAFQIATEDVDPEIRDVMHYALFSVTDRFCITSAWLLAPQLAVSPDRFALPAVALETLRCSTVFKTRPRGQAGRADLGLGGYGGGSVSPSERYVEPALSEAATYGLVALAFQILLSNPSGSLAFDERARVAAILSKTASPVRVLTALHREAHLSAGQFSKGRLGGNLPTSEIQRLQQEKIAPIFEATGEVLTALAKTNIRSGALADWFKKLGLFAYMLTHWSICGGPSGGASDELYHSPSELGSMIPASEAMDAIMSLETDLLERAKELGIQSSAHDIVEPLADALKAQLQ